MKHCNIKLKIIFLEIIFFNFLFLPQYSNALPYPVGIADLLSPKTQTNIIGLQNNAVEWLVIRAPWYLIEPEKNVYDFSYIETNINLAKAYNKKVRLNIHGGAESPNWVKAEVPYVEYTKTNQQGVSTLIQVPVPWNPLYQNYYSRLIQRVAQNFSNDVAAVSVCGFDEACGFYLGPTEETKQKWESVGFSKEVYLQTIGWGVDLYASQFQNSFLLLHFGQTFDDYTISQDAVNNAVAKYGKDRIGLLQENLNVKSTEIIKKFFYNFGATGGLIGYQTLWSIANDTRDVIGCSNYPSNEECLKAVFDKGINGGARFFEIYQADVISFPSAIEYGYQKIYQTFDTIPPSKPINLRIQ